MRAVFFGSPPHAVPVLASLTTVADVPLVVTVPDAARGRSRRPVPSAVGEAAAAWGIPLAKPQRPAEVGEQVAALAPDVAVVTAYRGLIPPGLLDVPAAGFVNVHFSVLPRWRGASPVVRAILAGDTTTGVSIMVMDEGLDTGPVLAVREMALDGTETAGIATARLAALGAAMAADTLADHVAGRITPAAQDEPAATAARRVSVSEAFVDPARHTTEAVLRAVRAFDPRPGAWCVVDGARLKVWGARPAAAGPEPGSGEPGPSGVVVGTSDGAVELTTVQPEGRPRMEAAAWARGRRGGPIRFTLPSEPR